MTESYRVNTDDIMHETIDGEVVIVNLDTGAYYAFDGSGEYIWERMSQGGANRDQLVSELKQGYTASEEELERGVDKFLGELKAEQLIVPAEGADEAVPSTVQIEAGAEFVVPQLNKYTDMEALLLADPIHEVEPEGWPNVK